jgi:hypothetical protein
MDPLSDRLTLYGTPSDSAPLEWGWVDEELSTAGTYWVAAGGGRPQPRPVWGVWNEGTLHLSIGSPTIRHAIEQQPLVTVHLDSSIDVVILEGEVAGTTDDPSVIARYDRKYDWTYDVVEYGPLTTIVVDVVMAWRSAGRAGRDGFSATGRWQFRQQP